MRQCLLIQPDEADAGILYGLLCHLNWNVVPVSSGAFALEALEAGCQPAAVICAAQLPDMEARDVLHAMKEKLGPACAIVTTEVEGVDTAYTGRVLSRPFGLEKLVTVLGVQPSSLSTSSSAIQSSTTPGLPSPLPSAGR